jgi:hypothetical protein
VQEKFEREFEAIPGYHILAFEFILILPRELSPIFLFSYFSAVRTSFSMSAEHLSTEALCQGFEEVLVVR